MEILKGRPAGYCAIAAVIISLIAYYAKSVIPLLSIIALSVIFCPVVLRFYKSGKLSSYRLFTCLVLIGLIILICIRCMFVYFDKEVKADEFIGEDKTVTGKITGERYANGYYTEYFIDLISVDARKCNMNATLSCMYVCDLKEGYCFEITGASVKENSDTSLMSDSIFLSVESDDYRTLSVISLPENNLSNKITSFKKKISGYIELTVGGEGGKLASGILLGSKDVSAIIKRDCRRSGVSHLLAVSGMHLSVISAFTEKMFKKIGIGKRLRLFITGAIMILYLIMLGFPLSAVRSVSMLVLTYVGYFFGIGSDSLSSLSVSVVLILTVSPASVFDAGFILTVCATLGITSVMHDYTAWKYRKRKRKEGLISLFFSGATEKRKKKIYSFLCFCSDKLINATVTSFSVNMLTVLPVALFYGEISLMTFPSNIVLPPLASVIMILSLFTLIFYPIKIISGMFGYYTSVAANLFINIVSKISLIRNVTFSLRYDFVPYILIPATCITCILLIVRLKRKITVCLPSLAAVLCIAICTVPEVYASNLDYYCISDKAGEGIGISGGNTVLICDVSSGSSKILNAAYAQTMRNGATEIETVVLTHYHARHISALTSFMSKNCVRSIWLPEPLNASDAGNFIKIYDLCLEFNVKCFLYGKYDKMKIFDDLSLILSGPVFISRSTHPVVLAEIEGKGQSILYLGKSAWESEICAEFCKNKEFNTVIFSSHGPVAKNVLNFPIYGTKETVYREEEILLFTVPTDILYLDKMKQSKVSINTGVLHILIAGK